MEIIPIKAINNEKLVVSSRMIFWVALLGWIFVSWIWVVQFLSL
jgi:hypothetical protein